MSRFFPRAVFLVGLAFPAAFPASSEPPSAWIKIMPAPAPAPGAPPPTHLPSVQPVIVIDRFARARDNLLALVDGRISTSDLGPRELQDVLDFDRQVRGGASATRPLSKRCVEEEVRRHGGRPTRLAWRVIDLKCRSMGRGYPG